MNYAILFCLALASAALPPGYEEELYCPAHMCLKQMEQRPGWSGPRADFRECCDEAMGKTRRPHSWGEKVAPEVKEELIHEGWHQNRCTQQKGVCGAGGDGLRTLARMLSRMDDYLR